MIAIPRKFASLELARLWVVLLLLCLGVQTRVQAADSRPGNGPPSKEVAVVALPKDIASLRALEERFEKVAARAVPCTVALRIGTAQGSGVLVSKDGYVLTAGHVLGSPGQKVEFVLPNGKTAAGITLGLNRDLDAGLAKITEPGQWPFLEMGSAAPQPGTWCLALGHPLGPLPDRPPVVRTGRLLKTSDHSLQTDCLIVSGDSGGPLVDLDGRVIGIHTRINAGMNDMNFHVAIEVFRRDWDRLLKGETIEVRVPGKDSAEIKAVFRQAAIEPARAVVRVQCDGRDAALGTIVGPDGWILTKASEMGGKIVCQYRDGRKWDARTVGVHPGFDLAMLKVEASGLPAIDWTAGQKQAAGRKYAVGQWVASLAPGDAPPLALGVLSVPPRKILPAHGSLGVILDENMDPASIKSIFAGSPAEKAGLKPGDVITELDGKPMPKREMLRGELRQRRPGTAVKLRIKRGSQELEIPATLAKVNTPDSRRRDLMNQGGLGISRRHDDFPIVLQHDSVVAPHDCGGPLVNLDGRVIGVNIARAGRTETYAVPSRVLLGLMYDLMSGRLAPVKK